MILQSFEMPLFLRGVTRSRLRAQPFNEIADILSMFRVLQGQGHVVGICPDKPVGSNEQALIDVVNHQRFRSDGRAQPCDRSLQAEVEMVEKLLSS